MYSTSIVYYFIVNMTWISNTTAWGKHPLKSVQICRFPFSENITHYRSTPLFSQKIFITLRSRVQIPVSLHENQGLTLNRGSFSISAWGFAWGLLKKETPIARGLLRISSNLKIIIISSFLKWENSSNVSHHSFNKCIGAW